MKIVKNILVTIVIILIAFVFLTFLYLRTDFFWQRGKPNFDKKKYKSVASPSASIEMQKAYSRQFFEMFRDPLTNTIPENIKLLEEEFINKLKEQSKADICLSQPYTINWLEAGPNDVGGRTRALAVDVTNPDIILAGGVSGGLWKSTDHGNTWHLKSNLFKSHSVTSLAQDTRKGYTHIWYYGTGEYKRNSVLDQVMRNWYWGDGIFKSTDNGESWELLENTKCDPESKKSNFNFVSNIVVCPITGYVFVASNEKGILRSTNGGKDFEFVLGGTDSYYFTDVAKASDGKIIGFLSQYGTHSGRQITPGIYVSYDHGDTWKNVTPSSYPKIYQRAVLATTPAKNNIAYVFTYTGLTKANGSDDVRLHKIFLDRDSSVNLTDNLPNNPELSFIKNINVQDNYNMLVSVKPDNENYVIVGGTCLYRSFDGFSTYNKDGYNVLIGGYHPKYFMYPNQHPDEHIIAFDPRDPNKMWCGHDGGISFAPDIRSNCDTNNPLPWTNKNNGYNVTQYYSVAMFDSAGDTRLMGGSQDNGSPYFKFDGKNTSKSLDVSGGDGSFGYIGKKHLFSAIYLGMVFRVPYDKDGEPDIPAIWNAIWPKDAKGQIFYNPFAIDPNDENVMYYPSGNTFWRNKDLSAIPEDYVDNGTTINWSKLDDFTVPTTYRFTAIAVSKNNPKHTLYLGVSSQWENPQYPFIFKFENCNISNQKPIKITIPNAVKGAYINQIAINPDDANEVIVIMSNYNIIGLYHTTNGGLSWEPIEGNLAGDENNPGPALTSATILPTEFGNIYLVGTTIGVFSTMKIDGMGTNWKYEANQTLGNILVYDIKSRKSDGRIAVATWGRGIFVGYPDFSTFVENDNYKNDFIIENLYPNPTKDYLKLAFRNNTYAYLNICIYNILGIKIKQFSQGFYEPAKHEIIVSLNNLTSGIYFIRLESKGKFLTRIFEISR